MWTGNICKGIFSSHILNTVYYNSFVLCRILQFEVFGHNFASPNQNIVEFLMFNSMYHDFPYKKWLIKFSLSTPI